MSIKNHIVAIVSMICLNAIASDVASKSIVKLKPIVHEYAGWDNEATRKELTKLETATSPVNKITGEVYRDTTRIRMFRLALAQQGDKAARQQIFSAMKSGMVFERANAISDAARLGDREAVYHLAEMLNDKIVMWEYFPPTESKKTQFGFWYHEEENWMTLYEENGTLSAVFTKEETSEFMRGRVGQHRGSHFDPPRMQAARCLGYILENPPEPPAGTKRSLFFYTDEEMAVWQEWWREHKSEFAEFEERAEVSESSPTINEPVKRDVPEPSEVTVDTLPRNDGADSNAAPASVSPASVAQAPSPAGVDATGNVKPPDRRVWLWWLALPAVACVLFTCFMFFIVRKKR
jgi:hypothetical protein